MKPYQRRLGVTASVVRILKTAHMSLLFHSLYWCVRRTLAREYSLFIMIFKYFQVPGHQFREHARPAGAFPTVRHAKHIYGKNVSFSMCGLHLGPHRSLPVSA